MGYYSKQEVPMERHSEFPLFFQSAIALVGFLLVASLLSWAFEPKNTLQNTAASNISVTEVK
jgi:hypothetical protein